MANARSQKPHGSDHHDHHNVKDGTLALQPSPRPGLVGREISPDPISGPPRDIFILFGGWGGFKEEGKPWPPGTAEGIEADPKQKHGGSAKVFLEVQKIKNPGRELRVIAFSGSLIWNEGKHPASTPNIDRAIEFIRSNYHPRGKLVIYGYSAGGVDAQDLVWKIGFSLHYFEPSSGEFYTHSAAWQKWRAPDCGFVFRPRRDWREAFVPVRVDLLLTVDAGAGPFSNTVSRLIDMCVRRNLNFYQTIPSDTPMPPTHFHVGSHGAPNTPADQASTTIDNQDMTKEATAWLNNHRMSTGQAHDQFDVITGDAALQAIRAVLVAPHPHAHAAHYGR